jgi:hypothetical protein
VGIHQPEKRLTASQQRIEPYAGLLLEPMELLRQTQRQQSFTLAALADERPAGAGGSPLQAFKA